MTQTKRVTIWVSPHQESTWAVKQEGSTDPVSVHTSKVEALREATALAEDAKPSQVKVQRRDGTIEEERTYGSDPFPPKG